MIPTCPYCNRLAFCISGTDLYRNRADLADKWFWHCQPCGAYVGCHPDTKKPMGPLAKSATRKARRYAHDVFDLIWRGHTADGMSKGKARRTAYRWLASQLNVANPSIGEMEREECARVIAVCQAHLKQGARLIEPLPKDKHA